MAGRYRTVLAINVGAALAYLLAGKVGLSLAFVNASASAVWPPTGLALAATLLLGARIWPGILVGAFLVNWTTTGAIGSSAMIAGGNTLEALIGAVLANRFAAGSRSLMHAQDIVRLIFFAALPSTALCATCGATALVWYGLATRNEVAPIWRTWWLGDFISALTIAPLVLVWFAHPLPKWPVRRWIEAAWACLAVAVASSIIFLQWLVAERFRHYPTAYFAVPFLLWGAFRFHLQGAVTFASIISTIALIGTLHGIGPFAGTSPNTSLLLLQGFMGVSTVTALVVASLIAERQRLLKREQHARAEAESANRSKDQFLAVLSHELRTPLTPILLTTSLLERREDLPLDVVDNLRSISRNVELEATLIDDLLDLTRITRGKLILNPAGVDLHALVHNAVEICAKDGSVTPTLDLRAANYQVRADGARIQQVLWNLLSNAQKFSPLRGSISVWSRDGADGWVEVGVTDTGIGIDPAVLPRLFAPFEQGEQGRKPSSGGLGLGLAIAKSLVEAHGGRLSARSDGPGRGATFLIELPQASRPVAVQVQSRNGDGAPSIAEQAAPQRPLHILVVEDNAPTLAAIKRILTSLHHHVTTASTIASAIEAARTEPIDIVISDLGLPDGMGYELMTRIRAERAVPGIALSGYGMDEDVRRSKEAGFAEHLTKPVNVPQLVDAVHRAARQN